MWQYMLDKLYNNPIYSDLIYKLNGKKVFFVPYNPSCYDAGVVTQIESNGGRNDITVILMWALMGKPFYQSASFLPNFPLLARKPQVTKFSSPFYHFQMCGVFFLLAWLRDNHLRTQLQLSTLDLATNLQLLVCLPEKRRRELTTKARALQHVSDIFFQTRMKSQPLHLICSPKLAFLSPLLDISVD
jgi:hypothetical protein